MQTLTWATSTSATSKSPMPCAALNRPKSVRGRLKTSSARASVSTALARYDLALEDALVKIFHL